MKHFTIYQAAQADVPDAAGLALRLWSGHTLEELSEEFTGLTGDTDSVIFLAALENRPVGFAQCQLRRDYVEGTSTSPVGYLEGIYVQNAYRGQGCARALLEQCEAWAREKGCAEFASDCELANTASLDFHLRLGFAEANRVICFTKKL